MYTNCNCIRLSVRWTATRIAIADTTGKSAMVQTWSSDHLAHGSYVAHGSHVVPEFIALLLNMLARPSTML